jgi:transmembrane sensor
MKVNFNDDILSLIVRNLAGVADITEAGQLEEWLGSSEGNKRYYEQMRNVWEASDRHTDSKLTDTTEALKCVLEKISKRSSRRSFWYYWQKIAAVIVLPLTIGALLMIYFSSERAATTQEPVFNEVYATFGTRTALKLADGSQVWLNSASSLKYPDKFDQKDRRVYLNGEAYFEVKSDASRPFIVQTSSLQVKATGTRFSVLEYDSDPVTEITLVSGKVHVNNLDNSTSSRPIAELNPNQHIYYNRETGIKNVSEEDPYKYIAWKDGKLIFRNDSLSRVVTKIGQVFNVEIELQGAELKDYRYRATFEDESLDEILKLLKISAPIDFIELKRTPLPDGSFPKKKVVIFPAKTNK